jgi:hypothetical protein
MLSLRDCWPLIVLLLSSITMAAEPGLRVVTDGDGRPVAVEALGLSQEDLAALAKLPGDDPPKSPRLSLYLLDKQGSQQLPAMAGKYEVKGEALRFTPRFALRPGLTYQAEYFPPPAGPQVAPARLTKDIAIPAPPPREPAKVVAVYPSAAVLPENQLRFYLHFSEPMRQGVAYEHVKLIKPDGKRDPRAFFEIDQELWDTTGTRLTLLFDPGRTKRGLQPREEFGPVLLPGQKYTLVIDKTWPDADGRPLAAGWEKRFTAGTTIEEAVNPKEWKIAPPAAGTREPLVLRFPRPLDHALVQHMISVEGRDRKELAGEVTVADEERRWEFRPQQPWAAGDYSLVVNTTLEDSAGNNLARPFEVDVFGTAAKQIAPEYVRLPFSIRQ